MRNRLGVALFIICSFGGFHALKAQQTNTSKKADRPTRPVDYDPYTYTGKWYGYVTDSADFRLGYKATADQIKKSVAAGATYMLYNPHGTRLGLDPPQKIAAFAGQRVFVTASISSKQYGSGPTADANIKDNGGFANPEPRSIPTLKIISVEVTDLKDAYDPIVEKIAQGAR